jgi:hypothetical protein
MTVKHQEIKNIQKEKHMIQKRKKQKKNGRNVYFRIQNN